MNCSTAKKVYLNEYDAEDALVESRIKSTNGAVNMYLCEYCEYWHLTSKGGDLLSSRLDLQKRVEDGIRASKWL